MNLNLSTTDSLHVFITLLKLRQINLYFHELSHFHILFNSPIYIYRNLNIWNSLFLDAYLEYCCLKNVKTYSYGSDFRHPPLFCCGDFWDFKLVWSAQACIWVISCIVSTYVLDYWHWTSAVDNYEEWVHKDVEKLLLFFFYLFLLCPLFKSPYTIRINNQNRALLWYNMHICWQYT